MRTLFFVYGNIYGPDHPNQSVMLKYSTVKGTWEFVKPMRLKRRGSGVIASPSAVYVLGAVQ